MAWIILIVAGLFEIGWPVGLKLGWASTGSHLGWLAFAITSMVASGAFLAIAQHTIPIGTAYAVWTGVGAAGTFVLGAIVFGDALSFVRLLSILLIMVGIVGLKLG